MNHATWALDSALSLSLSPLDSRTIGRDKSQRRHEGGWILAPSIAALLMPINGLVWLIWWLMMSAGLFRLAKDTSDQEADPTVA